MSTPRPIAGLTKEQILARFNPVQMLNEIIEQSPEDFCARTAPLKEAWKSLTAEQQTAALDALSLHHFSKVAEWRQRHGWPPLNF